MNSNGALSIARNAPMAPNFLRGSGALAGSGSAKAIPTSFSPSSRRGINALSPRLRSRLHPRKSAALVGDAGRGNARQRFLEIVALARP
jgi:hypothetical protein